MTTRNNDRPGALAHRVRSWTVTVVALAAALVLTGCATAGASGAPSATVPAGAAETSDEALVASLPGFQNGNAEVNGVNLHYVTGGTGPPLVLLPGHPQTWWSYSKIMPQLAREHTVIAVDIRGMGSSDKPEGGYDKRTMAEDIYQLTRELGYDRVDIAGHDIGSMIAYSFAANHPEATGKLAMLDVAHPDESFSSIPMLPQPDTFGPNVTAEQPAYTWWFAFHQVDGLPEQLLQGDNARVYTRWILDYHLLNDGAMSPLDRAVYEEAYSSPDAIRAGNAWYQAFPQDIVDEQPYPVLQMPVLGLGGYITGATWLQAVENDAADFELVTVPDTGHFIVDEQPQFVTDRMLEFFR